MTLRKPCTIKDVHTGWCQGCGHGIVVRCIAEAAEQLGVSDRIVAVMDVACGAFIESTVTYNYLGAAHGRPIIAAAGVKRVLKDDVVIAHAGDGSAYAIGIESTIHAALRNENILALVVNNCVFGMTGGQMSPTSIIGQRTTSTPSGRSAAKDGSPFDVVKTLRHFDIAYLSRGSVDSPQEVERTQSMIKKALQKQLDKEGFCLVEVLSPCPTNWGTTPLNSLKKLREEIKHLFLVGEYIDKGGQPV